jgi:hypothetical protein
MDSIKLTGAHVSAIRADLLKSRVKLTIDIALDDQMLDAKRMLAILAVDDSPLDLEISEQQMRLPLKET